MLNTLRMNRPLGYFQFAAGSVDASTLLSSVAGGIPAGSIGCLITAETQAIRWRDDGTAPTTAVGMPLAVNQPFDFVGNLPTFRMISAVAGAVVNVAFYGAL